MKKLLISLLSVVTITSFAAVNNDHQKHVVFNVITYKIKTQTLNQLIDWRSVLADSKLKINNPANSYIQSFVINQSGIPDFGWDKLSIINTQEAVIDGELFKTFDVQDMQQIPYVASISSSNGKVDQVKMKNVQNGYHIVISPRGLENNEINFDISFSFSNLINIKHFEGVDLPHVSQYSIKQNLYLTNKSIFVYDYLAKDSKTHTVFFITPEIK